MRICSRKWNLVSAPKTYAQLTIDILRNVIFLTFFHPLPKNSWDIPSNAYIQIIYIYYIIINAFYLGFEPSGEAQRFVSGLSEMHCVYLLAIKLTIAMGLSAHLQLLYGIYHPRKWIQWQDWFSGQGSDAILP